MRITAFCPERLILNKYTYYEDKSIACVIINTDRSVQNLEDVSSQYTIQIYDREYDGEGKWISSTNYRVEDVTDLEGLNLDAKRQKRTSFPLMSANMMIMALLSKAAIPRESDQEEHPQQPGTGNTRRRLYGRQTDRHY